MDKLFEVTDLVFSYVIGKQKVEAIRGLNLSVEAYTFATISGPSGSGKSTLLNILGLIEPVQEGKVLFFGEEIGRLSEKEKNKIRRHRIAFIFQQFHLIPVLTAEENVEYFLSRQGCPKEEARRRSKEALESVGLFDCRKHKPSQLSGGQKQRVAIARAIAKNPDVIIADEPTASLDSVTGKEILEILAGLTKSKKSSVILTTHDPMVQNYADSNVHLVDGRIV
jgi:ABC-type lipoprotein export system ATPase subunit